MSSLCVSRTTSSSGFEHRGDADRFLAELRDRFAKFGLELAPGQDAADRVRSARRPERRQARGLGKPETFDFPGFHAHLCDRAAGAVLGSAQDRGETDAGQAASRSTTSSRRAGIHPSRSRDGGWPVCCEATSPTTPFPGNDAPVVLPSTRCGTSGFGRCGAAASAAGSPGNGWAGIATRWLPPTRVMHPYPEVRFAATYPRQEPSAVIPLAGICAGGGPNRKRTVPTATDAGVDAISWAGVLRG